MKPDPSGGGLLESEREAVEDLVGAEPDVGIAADVDAGAERLAVTLPGSAVRALAHHDEVGVGHFGNSAGPIVDLASVLDVDSEFGGALAEDVEQGRPADAEPVPG